MASLEAALDKLREERNALNIEIRRHQLRNMPLEVLSLIFTFTFRPYHAVPEPAPWSISAVCTRWRNTVISQPCFWTSFDIQFPHKGITTFRLETQLARSGTQPLKIQLLCEDNKYSARERSIIEILAQYSVRWKTMSLSGPASLYSDLQGRIRHLPLLRKLGVEMVHESREAPTLAIFYNAPLLQQVSANRSWVPYPFWGKISPLSMVLPWSQLLRYCGSNTWARHLYSTQQCRQPC
ncbi:hypothetical protein C8F04DRAFT_1051739 [Mycena alexandri]|uniref:F-box domain-containing protein n=1 Tax=Mycena alexandri TaxID=1745969 RepID=A0AAD6S1T2_9AGAR|nr:hypothetical protein C8F04DRAFT_1051739 [Mycena alexandri]